MTTNLTLNGTYTNETINWTGQGQIILNNNTFREGGSYIGTGAILITK
jgi:hypothetical protein